MFSNLGKKAGRCDRSCSAGAALSIYAQPKTVSWVHGQEPIELSGFAFNFDIVFSMLNVLGSEILLVLDVVDWSTCRQQSRCGLETG